MSLPHFTVALPQRPRVRGAGGASCLGKNVRGLEWPGLGSGLAIVPQEKVIRKWNLDQLTAVFVQGRVGWEKCFWKLFFFFPSLHFPRWDKCKPCLQKHAAGDHISSLTKKCRGAERRGVKRYLLKQRESRGTRLVWQEHQTKYTVYSICLPEMSLPIRAEAQVSGKAFLFFFFLNVANSGNYSDHSNIPEQRSHSLCSSHMSACHNAAAGAEAAGQGLGQLRHLFNF